MNESLHQLTRSVMEVLNIVIMYDANCAVASVIVTCGAGLAPALCVNHRDQNGKQHQITQASGPGGPIVGEGFSF